MPDSSSPLRPRPRLRVTALRPRPEVAVLRPVGAMDVAGGPVVAERIGELAPSCECLVLDMRRVTFLDAGGIHALLDGARAARRAAARLILVGLDPTHHRVLRICGVESELTLADVADGELIARVALPLDDGAPEEGAGSPAAGV